MANNKKKITIDSKFGGGLYSGFIIGYVLLSLVVGAILQAVGLVSNTLYTAISLLVPILSVTAPVVLVSKKSGRKIFDVCMVKKFDPVYLLPSITISLGMFFGVGFINQLFADFLTGIGANVPQSLVIVTNIKEFILFTFLVGILPPIFEEVFFRGVLLGSLKKSHLLLSSTVVALCFAFYHASLVQLFYQLIYGFVLSVLTIKSGSVIPSIISHFINNFLILVLTYFFGIENAVTEIYLIIIGVALLIGSVVFLLFYKQDKKKKTNESVTPFIAFASAGIILCLIIAVVGVL